ncbi:YdaS family helix-turn-helix protein [Parasutterella secunda]|uniref:Helix-turn-helix domain-containing protein n=1 Tax=Parasutterella secunda TaxID=626947 RepID=A0ABS2GUR4_9BURK|nr:YdaS family helix-turn-helix protein [Parasutterella secunda]MBM6928608.1 helix-turn-helix domain-containing protein [Parasutterella secunda]
MKENLISKAIEIVGLCKLAQACGVRHQSIYRWVEKGSLPRTDWTGETDYASRIEEATKGAVTRAQLLNFKRSGETDAGKPHQNQA